MEIVNTEQFHKMLEDHYFFNGDFIELKNFTYINIMSPWGYPSAVYVHGKKKTYLSSGIGNHPFFAFMGTAPKARYKENCIVIDVQSYQILAQKSQLYNGERYKQLLDSLFENLTEDSNPVLFFLLFKRKIVNKIIMPYSKKYIILCIIILLMTALDVCLIYKIKVEKMDYNNTIRDVTTRNILSNLYKINVDVNLINNGIALDSLLLMKNVSNKEEQKIIDVFQGTNKLFICRFSELNCQECTIYSILKTISHSDSIGKNNIVFWGDYENSKNLSIIKERLGIGDMNVYNLPYINIPAERIGTPYYFVIDTTLTMSDFFIPDRSFPSLTDHYFEIIKKKYFMQSITN